MSREISIKINKSDEGSFGFSLLGKFSGIPHVIYDVIEDSPAAECRVSNKNIKKIVKWKKIAYIFVTGSLFFGISD